MTVIQIAETVASFVAKFRPVTYITDDVTETEFRLPDDLKTLVNREVRYRYMESSYLTTYGTIRRVRPAKKGRQMELLIEPHDKDRMVSRWLEAEYVVAYVWRAVR